MKNPLKINPSKSNAVKINPIKPSVDKFYIQIW